MTRLLKFKTPLKQDTFLIKFHCCVFPVSVAFAAMSHVQTLANSHKVAQFLDYGNCFACPHRQPKSCASLIYSLVCEWCEMGPRPGDRGVGYFPSWNCAGRRAGIAPSGGEPGGTPGPRCPLRLRPGVTGYLITRLHSPLAFASPQEEVSLTVAAVVRGRASCTVQRRTQQDHAQLLQLLRLGVMLSSCVQVKLAQLRWYHVCVEDVLGIGAPPRTAAASFLLSEPPDFWSCSAAPWRSSFYPSESGWRRGRAGGS